MSSDLTTLLQVSAIIIGFNLAASIFMYLNTGHKYYKKYIALWFTSSLNFTLQGYFQENHFLLSACMGISFFYVYIFVDIFSDVVKVRHNRKLYIGQYVFANILSFALHFFDFSFIAVATPISIAVAFPALHFVLYELRFPILKSWVVFIASLFVTVVFDYNRIDTSIPITIVILSFIYAIYNQLTLQKRLKTKLNLEQKVYAVSLIVIGFHYLDYPYLRMIPSAALFGFSLALAMVLVFSYLLNAILLFNNNELMEKRRKFIEAEFKIRAHEIKKQKNIQGDIKINFHDENNGLSRKKARGKVIHRVSKIINDIDFEKNKEIDIIFNSKTGDVRLKEKQDKQTRNLTLIES